MIIVFLAPPTRSPFSLMPQACHIPLASPLPFSSNFICELLGSMFRWKRETHQTPISHKVIPIYDFDSFPWATHHRTCFNATLGDWYTNGGTHEKKKMNHKTIYVSLFSFCAHHLLLCSPARWKSFRWNLFSVQMDPMRNAHVCTRNDASAYMSSINVCRAQFFRSQYL